MIWRSLLDQQNAALTAELDRQLELHAAEAGQAARRQTSERLNIAIRRLRQSPAESQTLRLITELASTWADRVVVLLREDSEFCSPDGSLRLATTHAPAIVASSESRDPAAVLISADELGANVAEALGGEGKAWLFPVTVRQKCAAVILAAGAVTGPALETLSEAIGMRLEAQRGPVVQIQPTPDAAASGIVQIQSAPPAGQPRLATAWEDLSPEDQSRHLLAQRVARVRVAEMRLADAAKLEKAVFAGNIYQAFREPIDKAREEFLRYHLAKSATMVDYLHLELLRSLAHDDELLLGADYPGPMV